MADPVALDTLALVSSRERFHINGGFPANRSEYDRRSRVGRVSQFTAKIPTKHRQLLCLMG